MSRFKLFGLKVVPASADATPPAFEDRLVAHTADGGRVVLTLFLGVNQGIFSSRALVFETTISGTADDEVYRRYSTWAEAEAGHRAAVLETFGPDHGRYLLERKTYRRERPKSALRQLQDARDARAVILAPPAEDA